MGTFKNIKKCVKKYWNSFFTVAAIFISIISLCHSYFESKEASRRHCKDNINRLISSIEIHSEIWKDNYEKRIEFSQNNVTEIIQTKIRILENLKSADEYLDYAKALNFSRKVIENNVEKSQIDSLGTYIAFLKNMDFNYYAVKADPKILKSTMRSISDLSLGVVGILNKVKCE